MDPVLLSGLMATSGLVGVVVFTTGFFVYVGYKCFTEKKQN
jgi:hypothetical protein